MDLPGVIDESRRFGPLAYVATVSASATPYVSPVAVAWIGDELNAFVASAEAKVANIRVNPNVSVHWPVGEATGWDSCIVWGEGRIVDDTEGRRDRWGQMGYDLAAFEPGGPESDGHVFLAIRPTKAVVLRQYGIGGRETWPA